MLTSIIAGPGWAHGCGNCHYGVRNEYYKPPTGAVELLLERLVNAERVGPAYFCECQAGQHLRAHLREIRRRYDAMTMRFGGEVEIGKVMLQDARHTMNLPHHQFSAVITTPERTPTVHFEQPAEQPPEAALEPTP